MNLHYDLFHGAYIKTRHSLVAPLVVLKDTDVTVLVFKFVRLHLML